MLGHVKILPADIGDAILIRYYGNDQRFHNILVDGGLSRTYHFTLKHELREIKKRREVLDLLIVTHIDSDHIGGILALLRDEENHSLIQNYWFNSGRIVDGAKDEKSSYQEIFLKSDDNRISYRQGSTLESFLASTGKWHKDPIQRIQEHDFFGANLKVLSPDFYSLQKLCHGWKKSDKKINTEVSDCFSSIEELCNFQFQEDTSVANGSSIAFLFTIRDFRILLLSDSQPSIIAESLRLLGYSERKKLKVNSLKVSHHGSKANTSMEMLNLIECENYILSTSGRSNNFPHKATLARIICNASRDKSKKINFIFNYNNPSFFKIFSDQDRLKYNFECLFPKDQDGYKINIL